MIYKNDYEERRSFGEALRRKRSSMRLSQSILGWEVGVAHNSISQYESTGRGISLLTALNIAACLDWSIEEWEADARKIYQDNSWRRAGRRGKREHDDDYLT